MLQTADFDYDLPPERIAQRPLDRRDASRLLVLNRDSGRLEHRQFTDLPAYLRPGDVVVANDSRVIPARLFGRKAAGGGRVEILLIERLDGRRWRALVGGRRVTPGTAVALEKVDGEAAAAAAEVETDLGGPQRVIAFDPPLDESLLAELGRVPLPPYIHEPLADAERYQTIYARPPGSAAAPTAGLHLTADLILALRERGVLFETVTLHVGLDTFRPVESERVADHAIHSEWASLSPEGARRINEAKLAGGRIVAVGTTAMRVLETAALRSAGLNGTLAGISQSDADGVTTQICPWRPVAAFEGRTDLFIYPGYRFRAVDVLITNFHLPRSSLLLLVSAFAGRERVLEAYAAAVAEGYRFYSFGDAMLIV
jgi:S-adenosylmethionine:tRNA ribosyltransferase-isomerase